MSWLEDKTVIVHKDVRVTNTVVTLMWRSHSGKLETVLYQVATDMSDSGHFKRRLYLRERWCCDDFAATREQEEVRTRDEGLKIALRRVANKYAH